MSRESENKSKRAWPFGHLPIVDRVSSCHKAIAHQQGHSITYLSMTLARDSATIHITYFSTSVSSRGRYHRIRTRPLTRGRVYWVLLQGSVVIHDNQLRLQKHVGPAVTFIHRSQCVGATNDART